MHRDYPGGLLVTKWTNKDEATLRALYPVTDTAEVARLLGRSERACRVRAYQLGIRKQASAKRIWTRGNPNVRTWMNEDAARFTRGKPSPKRKPIGSEFVTPGGSVYIKVSATGDISKDWRLKSRVVMEKKLGRPLARSEVVRFKDGDKRNLHPDNLSVVERRQMMAKASVHNLPKDIAGICRARGQITRALRKYHGN